MKLSIIVPVYKVEPFLRRCVDSILAQTFTDFELILVDDGSPDGCPAICDEYAEKDPRINVIHQKNGGPSAARNNGLDAAQGDYIGFIDGDDCIHPQMYESLLYAIEAGKGDIAQCDILQFTEVLPRFQQINSQMIDDSMIVMRRQDYIENFYPENRYLVHPSVCSKICHKSVFQNIRFPLGKFYEDSFVQLPLLDTASRVIRLPMGLYFYYQRPGSTMHANYDLWWATDMDIICQNNLAYFKKLGIKEQIDYAVDDYLTRFCKNKFAVYCLYPQLKNAFKKVESNINKLFFGIIFNPKICKLKKLMFLFLYISPVYALKLTRKYFPECLHEFMRD